MNPPAVEERASASGSRPGPVVADLHIAKGRRLPARSVESVEIVAAPCKLLDDTIGPDAQVALRRRGGSICRVLEGGAVALGDSVELSVELPT